MTAPVSADDRPIIRIEDWEALAEQTLPKGAFDYVHSGAGAEETLRKNERAFQQWDLLPKILTNVENVNLGINLLNRQLPTPLLLAPVGFQTVVHPEGELASARSAAGLGIPYITSTVSSFSLEDISAVMENVPRYFQLYWPNDEEVAASFVTRAEAAGYDAIVLTVDTALLGWREKDLQNRYFPMQTGAGTANFVTDPVFQQKYNPSGLLTQEELTAEIKKILLNQSLTWEKIAWLRQQTSLPILLKGIIHTEDGKKAVAYGADGIIVSNHGGRQLDGVRSSLNALPFISKEIQGEIPILFDSGIRRGPDILKAIALGADAVIIGRPYVYGLTLGQAGVTAVLTNLLHDLETSLALTGTASLSDIDGSLIARTGNSQ
ncbi:FMN-dependent dehydrogenase, includes L-lactate dehydrogenase and type II isopentenyl diphosphate isomerase [Evansella caseinilytica]|uniref:L-lactate oxidase n=1 Tax=Evansella caseinilytica TaxID=1503961 RepID=A0A1H3UNY5_9BACI|nr:alpha-hydroxy-acid oxidizing protein [Evansella caseinilytica]SDZ63439.1 FMN-dependent dehydrogenase, includes L-lactate dehydrogenase and type II isopentenyl diphosphate isomerase [Evansella caseinilytica]